MCDNVSFLGRKSGRKNYFGQMQNQTNTYSHILTNIHIWITWHVVHLFFFYKKNWLDIFTRDSYRWKFRKAVYYVIFVLPPNNQQVSPSSLTSFKGDFVETLLRCSVQMIMNNFWSPFWSQINYVQFSRCKEKSNLSG